MSNSTDSIADLAADAAITAGLLGSGQSIALTSGAVLLAAISYWILGYAVHPVAFLSSVLVALLQGYFAQRVRFDASLFRLWATRWRGSLDPLADMMAFDARIGRRPSASDSAQASLAERGRGALRLLRYQAASGLLQLILTAVALWR